MKNLTSVHSETKKKPFGGLFSKPPTDIHQSQTILKTENSVNIPSRINMSPIKTESFTDIQMKVQSIGSGNLHRN